MQKSGNDPKSLGAPISPPPPVAIPAPSGDSGRPLGAACDYRVWHLATATLDKIVMVEDDAAGGRTVTGDLDTVLGELWQAGWLTGPGDRLFYRDECGMWAEVKQRADGSPWGAKGWDIVRATVQNSEQVRCELQADRAARRVMRDRERQAANDRAKHARRKQR